MNKIEYRNRLDAYEILVVQPGVNLNNINIDLMIFNISTHFESILNNSNCEMEQRKVPNFDVPHRRVRRGILKNWFKTILKQTGKFLGWTVVLTTAGTVGSNTAVWLDHYLGRDDYDFVQNREKSCEAFKFGCHNQLCWVSCGPRRTAADWCFAKGSNPNTNYTTPFGIVSNAKNCKYDSECKSCDDCSSECYRDDGNVSIE